MTSEDWDAKLLRLEAVHEISNLQSRYNHYIFMNRLDPIVEMFARTDPNVRVEIGDSGVYEGIEGVKRIFLKVIGTKHGARGGLGLHMPTTPVIEVGRDGQTARGMWFAFGAATRRDEIGLRALWMAGKYDNEFVREEGKWKFRSLRYYVVFRTPFEEGWVKKPMVGSETDAAVQPDRPSTYYMPYHPDGYNSYLPAPPEPE